MSNLKEEMMQIHENTDFKANFAGITQLGEFKYTHGGSVKPGLEYHIHYTNDKEEVFMTGGTHNSSSKIIEKVNDSFPSIDDSWYKYWNPIEVKYANDKINSFPSIIKDVFYFLSSNIIKEKISKRGVKK